jgi:hypothetical protein
LLIRSTSIVSINLTISIIDVNAVIQNTGITIHHTLAVSSNYTDVGWYRYGSVPRNLRNAIIDRHKDNGFDLSAVFKKFNKLKIGDDIYTINESGQRQLFKVTQLNSLGEGSLTEALFSNTSQLQLILIGCDGI